MPLSSEEQELVTKVSNLVRQRFANDFQAAFNHYSRQRGNSEIERDELNELLKDANIGNPITRGSWVAGIMRKLDLNQDGFISWREFRDIMPQ